MSSRRDVDDDGENASGEDVRCEIVGTGLCGTGPTMILSVSCRSAMGGLSKICRRMAFNCGENTQRICADRRVKLRDLSEIYFTRLDASVVSGLPGTIFTLSSFGASNLLVVGPKGTGEYVNACRVFARRRYPVVRSHDINTESGNIVAHVYRTAVAKDVVASRPRATVMSLSVPVTSDTNGTTYKASRDDAMDLIRSFCSHDTYDSDDSSGSDSSSSCNSSSGDEDDDDEDGHDNDAKPHDEPQLEESVNMSPKPVPSTHCTAYAARVELPKSKRTVVVVVIDLFRSASVRSVTTCSCVRELVRHADVVFHFVDVAARRPRSWNAWFSGLPQENDAGRQIEHRVVDPHKVLLLSSFTRQTITLNAVAPACFPLPCLDVLRVLRHRTSDFKTWIWSRRIKSVSTSSNDPETTLMMVRDMQSDMWRDVLHGLLKSLSDTPPSSVSTDDNDRRRKRHRHVRHSVRVKDLSRVHCACTTTSSCRRDDVRCSFRDYAENYASALELRHRRNGEPISAQHASVVRSWRHVCDCLFGTSSLVPIVPPHDVDNRCPSISIVVLGTAAAAPTKHRNCSSNLLCMPDGRHVLVDCSEGTYGQLVAYCGSDCGAQVLIGRLRMIWISHAHLDHHFGLLRILEMRATIEASTTSPLLIVGPTSVGTFLSRARSWRSPHVQNSLSYRFVHCGQFNRIGPVMRQRELSMYSACSLTRPWIVDVISVPVEHCFDSWGLVVTLGTGQRVVFSGDTRPCQRLIQVGRHADVLVHEATFGEDEHDHAVRKKHCTILEAVKVARAMNISRGVVLTHFSARYGLPDIPESLCFDPRVVLAFDLTRIQVWPPRPLPTLFYLYPALREIFTDADATDEDEDEDHTTRMKRLFGS